MKVAFYIPDITPFVGGGYSFFRDFFAGLAAISHNHEFYYLTHQPLPDVLRQHGQEILIDHQTVVDDVLIQHGIGLFWFSSDMHLPFMMKVPFMVTVLDLQHRRSPWFPEVSTAGWGWEAREYFFLRYIQRAVYVITGAETGKDEICRYYGVYEDRVRVLPFPTPPWALSDDNTALDVAPGLDGLSYVFYPAQFWPHKNHVTILKALAELKKSGQIVHAVFTGTDKGNQAHVRDWVARLDLRQQVHFLGFVDQSTLRWLYQNALALVFASMFGPDNLPPLEAMALGCPVICAEFDGSHEQLGDAAAFFPMVDHQVLAGHITRIMTDTAFVDGLIERGHQRAAKSGYKDYARTMMALVDEFVAIRDNWAQDKEYVYL